MTLSSRMRSPSSQLAFCLVAAVAVTAVHAAPTVAVVCGAADEAAIPPAAETAFVNGIVAQLAASGVVTFAATPENAISIAAAATDLWGQTGAISDADAERYRGLLDVDALVAVRTVEFKPSANPSDAVGTVECVVAATGAATPVRRQVGKAMGEVAGLPALPERSGSAEMLLVNVLVRRVCAVVAEVLGTPLPAGPLASPAGAPVGEAAPPPTDVRGPGPSAITGSRSAAPSLPSGPTPQPEVTPEGQDTAQRHVARGDTYLGESRWEAAEQEYQLAIRLDPLLPAPHVRLGDIYADRGLWNDAITHYKDAVELAPADIPIRIALARVYEKAGQISFAENELQLAAKVDPANGSVQVSRGDLLQKLGRRRDAETAYLAALSAQEPDPRAYQRLALLYADTDRPKEALEYYVLAAKAGTDEAVPVVRREHYGPMMALADGVVEDALRQSSVAFDAFEEGKLTREEAFYALEKCAGQTRDVARFVEMVAPPVDAKATHAAREAAYALVQQSDACLRDYVDSNDRSLLEYAQTLREQAIGDLKALRSPHGAS